MKSFVVAAFYKFVALENLETLRENLLELCRENGIKGTILLAREGINATISGEEESLHRVLDWLQNDACFADLNVKFSRCEVQPFARLKVKIKPEIVTLGRPEISPTNAVGTYVKSADWNTLIRGNDVLLIDVRNRFEIEIGSFAGAVDPQTRSFRHFTQFAEEKLTAHKATKTAMFCTGGIRCEKASALLLAQGFSQIHHLEGGVLKYLEEIAPDESLFEGECFVFDERVSLDENLARGHFVSCEKCGDPIEESQNLCIADIGQYITLLKCPTAKIYECACWKPWTAG